MRIIYLMLIAFVIGFGTGAFLYHVYSSPLMRIRRKAAHDLRTRLGKDGKPLNPQNDYERHLFALKCKRDGKDADMVRGELLAMSIDVPLPKRLSYVNQVLSSIIVGYRLTAEE